MQLHLEDLRLQIGPPQLPHHSTNQHLATLGKYLSIIQSYPYPFMDVTVNWRQRPTSTVHPRQIHHRLHHPTHPLPFPRRSLMEQPMTGPSNLTTNPSEGLCAYSDVCDDCRVKLLVFEWRFSLFEGYSLRTDVSICRDCRSP